MSKENAIQNPLLADCSLDSEQLARRVERIRLEILPHAYSRVKLEDGLAWRFKESADMRRRLESLAALERECCPGYDFEIGDGPDGRSLQFSVRGIPPNSPFFELDALPIRRRPFLRRFGTAAFLSFLICCALPALLLALGFTVPWATWDDPWVILVVGLGIAAALWAIDVFRSRDTKAEQGFDCGC